MVDFIDAALGAGKPVGVSCGSGFGRTGTVLACYLVSTGLNVSEAIKAVRQKRAGSIETPEQENAIKDFYNRRQ